MAKKNLRIVVSGPPGSGKTTLVNALAARLELSVVAEDVLPVVYAEHLYRRVLRDAGSVKDDIRAAKIRWIQSFFAWTSKRSDEYAKHDRLIADRWEADLLDYWLVSFGKEKSGFDELTSKLLEDMQRKSRLLDFAIIIPLQEPFSADQNEDVPALRRTLSFTTRLLTSVLATGLIQQHAQVRVVNIPNAPLSVGERVELVVRAIEQDPPDARH